MINFHKLFEFKDRFSEFVIAGSGPSNFNYDFSKITLPIIFINDMHRLVKIAQVNTNTLSHITFLIFKK